MQASILAGGNSKRLGQDKAFIEIQGKRLIQRTLDTLNTVFSSIHIISAECSKFHSLSYPVIKDVVINKNSLGGLYTALIHSQTHWAFVCACDMPFLNTDLIQSMMHYLNHDYDVIVPRIQNRYQTLHAFYTKNCIPPIKQLLEKGQLKIRDFFSEVNIKVLYEKDLLPYDENLYSFLNINTKEDLARVEQIIQSR